MPIRVYFSNNLATLADRLADELQDERRRHDPFQPSRIIVPNPNLKKWLQLRLADRRRVAINLDFPFLEKGLWETLLRLCPPGDLPPQRLTQQELHLMIMSRLLQADEAVTCELGPLHSYLLDPDGQPRPDTTRRAWQIAGRLAALFLEYSYQRQEMVSAWQRDELSRDVADADATVQELERCQQALYRSILGPDGLRHAHTAAGHPPLQMLPELADETFSRLTKGAPAGESHPLHLFGLSQVSPFHRDLFYRLARYQDLHIYQMSVCAEFWEDVTTPGEDRWMRRQALPALDTVAEAEGEELAENPIENQLLKWWGKPGREALKLLSELEIRCGGEVGFESFWLPEGGELPASPTVLQWLQHQVLRRTGERPEPPAPQDRSLQILGCPGIFREVETIHQSILANMRDNPRLMLTDIAVLVPDMRTYRPVIEAVFQGAEHAIPYNLTDATAADDSVYGRGVIALLDLAAGNVSRRDVFELVLNPCFLAAARLNRQDALVWSRWADELQVFHSLDAEDKAARGYGSSPLYTWQQAMVRLRLGRIMEPAGEDAVGAPTGWRRHLPYADMESSDVTTLGAFCQTLEALFHDLRTLTREPLTAGGWQEHLLAVLDRHLQPPNDRPAERQVELALQAGLGQLRTFADFMKLQGSPEDDHPLDLALVTEFVRSILADIPSRHGNYLSGGVNIASLRPMRPIPFQVVYVLGLGEGEFPGMAPQSTLDLRHRFRRIGDVAAPEENRYLFLETLVSTRGKLYLSYINRDLAKDQLFHPCSVVSQLQHYLHSLVTGKPFAIEHLPLHSHSERYLQPQPAHCDAFVNFSENDRRVYLAEHHATAIPGVVGNAVRQAEPPPAPEEREPITRVTIRDLGSFLRNPATAAMRRHLRLYREELDDPLVERDEPFHLGFLEKYRLVESVLRQAVLAGHRHQARIAAVGLDLLQRTYEHWQAQGRTPDSPFAAYDCRQVRTTVEQRLSGGGDIDQEEALAHFTQRLADAECYPLVSLGRPRDNDTDCLIFPPPVIEVEVNGRPLQVELHGEQELVWHDTAASRHHILCITNSTHKKKQLSSQLLEPFLFLQAARLAEAENEHGMAAASWFSSQEVEVHLAHPEGIADYAYELSAESARAYLQGLLADYLDPRRFDLLPLAELHSLPLRAYSEECPTDPKEYHRLLAEACEDSFASRSDFGWTPSDLERLAAPTVPADAWTLIKQRLAPIFRECRKK